MDKSLVKGLNLLAALANSSEARGVSDLARELSLTKSNVHRLLQTLTTQGFVRHNAERGVYEPSLRLWELGIVVLARVDIRRVAAPLLAELANKTGESVHLSVLDGTEVVYIDIVESSHPVRAYSRVGRRTPAHCVATGKALLAHAPASVVAEVAEAASRLGPLTSHTITGRAALEEELARVRRLGHAVNRGERSDTVRGVAAPVWGPDGRVTAAIGIAGPAERLKPATIRQLAPAVMATASEITRRVGGVPPNQAAEPAAQPLRATTGLSTHRPRRADSSS
ncbi:IclR family transcriptional regulator [Limobrevibacterium gyesilva]|uniref:IclR family transcriptional regulator n=1 Tax=Limobrevibacterium gyesilva TaxID=2991712 RepID=A0AA41YHC3_9PROT|nr:IclR family transcriptional regulator [Limobrevibacterium gyesilva]MCW3473301.1 IclR family transcriptional regulator [Limobrevibacterium gyesilva]